MRAFCRRPAPYGYKRVSTIGDGPEDTVIRFTAYFDARDIEGMERFFADAGVWKRPDGDIVGIAGLRAFMQRRSPGVFTRHVISNMRTTVENDRAVVESYVTVYRHDFAGEPVLPAPLEGPDVVGRYRDALVNEKGTWKVAIRESIVEFKRS
jgi:hypothetical protein